MHTQPHVWRFYLSSREAWDAMYEDCRRAEKSIEMEQYIFENDAIGRRFMELFIEKAAQGVEVFLICDTYGSQSFRGSPLIDEFREKGGRFYFYHIIHRWDILRPWRWFPRTHIKALLVDSTIAYTGSTCFAERMIDWRDTQIRIMGPVVEQVKKAFARAEMVIQGKRPKEKVRVHCGPEEFVYLQSYPLRSWNVIYGELVKAIKAAQRYIYISTPFYAPNRRFRRLLRAASRRGVDVRILTPRHSDVPMVDWVFLSYAGRFLASGGRIFHYHRLLHGKTVVIDDEWATVGSTNMDVISFFRNRESNLVIRNKVAIAELRQHFMNDLSQSAEITAEHLALEPRWKFWIGYLGRVLKSFLWRR